MTTKNQQECFICGIISTKIRRRRGRMQKKNAHDLFVTQTCFQFSCGFAIQVLLAVENPHTGSAKVSASALYPLLKTLVANTQLELTHWLWTLRFDKGLAIEWVNTVYNVWNWPASSGYPEPAILN